MITVSENFRAVFYAPFYAAHAIRAYAAEGVEVELRPSPSPFNTASDLTAGRIDVMWGGPLRVMLTHATDPGADSVCFCDAIVRDPFFLIGRVPRADFRIADLAGVRFATVSEVPTPWICLQDDVRRAGLDPALLNRISGRTMAENAAALRDGELDAVQLFQPYAEELIASGAHVWYAAATRGLTAYTTLVTRRSMLVERRDELRAMVRGMTRAQRWVQMTEAAEIARTLAGFFPDLAPDILARTIERYRNLGLYATTPVMPREGFERLRRAMISGGLLSDPIAFEQCVDNSLAEEVVSAG